MKIHELKELTKLPLTALASKTGIEYKRILKLNKQTLEHSKEDYDLIEQYSDTMGNNIVEVDFKTKRADKRPPFSFERRGEINLYEYKLNKRRRERAEEKREREYKRKQEYFDKYFKQQN